MTMAANSCCDAPTLELIHDTGETVCVQCGAVVDAGSLVAAPCERIPRFASSGLAASARHHASSSGGGGAAAASGGGGVAADSALSGQGLTFVSSNALDEHAQWLAIAKAGPRSLQYKANVGLGTDGMTRHIYIAALQVGRVAMRMRLSSVQVKEVLEYFRRVRAAGPFGGTLDCIAAACVYVVCRSHSIPATFLQLAEAAQVNVFTLQRTFGRLVHHLKLSLPAVNEVALVESVVQAVPELSHEAVPILSQYAICLLELGKQSWVSSGRRPLPIALAATDLANQIYAQNENLPSILPQLCEKFGVHINTARARARELRLNLLQHAQALPWRANITERNVVAHVKLLVENPSSFTGLRPVDCDAEGNAPTTLAVADKSATSSSVASGVPRSFVLATRNSELRMAKLEAAKARLVAILALSTAQTQELEASLTADRDMLDLLLERLLLHGVVRSWGGCFVLGFFVCLFVFKLNLVIVVLLCAQCVNLTERHRLVGTLSVAATRHGRTHWASNDRI
ncbi:hypothetical protein, variant [Capsaspora owczarzaki ATCC 30864]|uniref:TFIIB-type domain-containing protein n=1 Tax=Capsaspora owczarzaki (strain ATCC 30864) TaxID=595528 RepID=A0A0D2U448_CAPO3|nr:hypothetical protein, variant [Capsaspora owczarzaki ATCC 30864]